MLYTYIYMHIYTGLFCTIVVRYSQTINKLQGRQKQPSLEWKLPMLCLLYIYIENN